MAGESSRSRHSIAPHSKYRILELIGQGQYGRVFCALNRSTGQLVALKELSHNSSPTNVFLRELWSLITLEHPNIVTCQALEHTATGRVLVMDYCEGGTLRQLLEQDTPMKLAEGLQLILGILAGLDYVHQRGIIHCDIKPENILLTLDRQGWLPRLSDFGIALRFPDTNTPSSSVDTTMGSPGYMAPERFYGLYSPGSDIYAVGIILYEMLMGDRPFQGVPGKLMWAHLNQRLQLPPSIPEALRAIVQKSLEKLPGRRFASAAEMAKALRQAMEDPAVQQVGDRPLPWEKNSESPCLDPLSESSQKFPLESDDFSVGVGESDKVEEIRQLPIANLPFRLPQKAAVEPQHRWLAMAIAKELRFYSLPQLQRAAAAKQPVSPLRTIPLPESTLPELIFLDRRHLLAITTDSEKSQTLLRIYNRRGDYLAEHFLPVIFKSDSQGRSLILSDEPYTLLGVSNDLRPAAFRIHLSPVFKILLTP